MPGGLKTKIEIDPSEPEAESPVTITVTLCTCTDFTIRVVDLGTSPPTEIDSKSGCNNPPAATLVVVPPWAGNYRVEVVCGSTVEGSMDFSAV